MTGLVRKASLLAVLGLMAASVALAGIPDPTQCTIPTYIDLVACNTSAVPDPYGLFTVTVNDAAGNPVEGCEVAVVFNTDLKVYNAIPGLTVDCTARKVVAVSDASGVATFTMRGAPMNATGNPVGSGANGATIYACEIALGQATVAVFDENGAVLTTGISGTDLSAWLADFGKQGIIGYKGRSDFDHNGAISGVDLSFWLQRFGGGYNIGCGTLCGY
jgi:hypothetical protein